MQLAAALIVLLLPAQVVAPGPERQTPPKAAAGATRPAQVRAVCPLPVYFRNGTVRCSEKPAITAFGRFTWMEGGRWITVAASRVDLKRTMPIHQRQPRGGGFSVTGSEEVGERTPAAGAAPEEVPAAPDVEVPAQEGGSSAAGKGRGGASPETTGLSAESRARLQGELNQAQTELEVLVKQYRALVLTGHAPSNTLSRAITERQQKIERIQRQLSR